MTGVDRQIGTVGDEAGEIIFRCGIDDNGHVPLFADLSKGRKGDLAVVDHMMGNDIKGSGRLVRESAFQLIVHHMGRLTDRVNRSACELDGLGNRGAITA